MALEAEANAILEVNIAIPRIENALASIAAGTTASTQVLLSGVSDMLILQAKGIGGAILAVRDNINGNIASLDNTVVAQGDRIFNTVNASEARTIAAVQQVGKALGDKVDKIQTTIDAIPQLVIDSMNQLVDQMIKDMASSIDRMAEEIAKSLERLIGPLTQSLDQLTISTNKLEIATREGAELIGAKIGEAVKFLTNRSHEDIVLLIDSQNDIARQMHTDTVNQTSVLRGGLDNVANSLNLAMLANVGAIGTIIAANTAAEAAAEAPQTLALASIAASLGSIVGGLSLIFGPDFTSIGIDPKKWLGELVASVSELYYELGLSTYDATAKKSDLED